MPITVGQDTAKTRTKLSVNGKSISYYSIPAATKAGLETASNMLDRELAPDGIRRCRA